MTATITPINGHDSAHALQELRNARVSLANAVHVAHTYLHFAHQINHIHGLGVDLPSDSELAKALDHINRLINPPPSAA